LEIARTVTANRAFSAHPMLEIFRKFYALGRKEVEQNSVEQHNGERFKWLIPLRLGWLVDAGFGKG